MPDFERITRKMELHLAPSDAERKIAAAYHAGLDRARREVALVALCAAAVVTLLGAI